MKQLLSLNDEPPYQNNLVHRGLTVSWSGSDDLNRYKKNLQYVESRDLLKKFGWIDANIEYCYNSHGFRSQEFDQRPCALALGCSFTEGTGLHECQTWPHILSKKLNLHVWNLGSGGASIDTVFRVFDHYIKRLDPIYVFVLIPPEGRFEYRDIDGGFPIMHATHIEHHQSFAKEWLTQTYNGFYNTRKTMLAIKQICGNFNKPLFADRCSNTAIYEDHIKVVSDFPLDLARDLMHRGPIYQQWVADFMYNFFKNNQEWQDE